MEIIIDKENILNYLSLINVHSFIENIVLDYNDYSAAVEKRSKGFHIAKGKIGERC